MPEENAARQILERYQQQGIQFHAFRTRQAGARTFLSVHVLAPGEWTVQRGHQVLEHLEAELEAAIPGLHVFTHLEPLDDPAVRQDVAPDHSTQHPSTESAAPVPLQNK